MQRPEFVLRSDVPTDLSSRTGLSSREYLIEVFAAEHAVETLGPKHTACAWSEENATRTLETLPEHPKQFLALPARVADALVHVPLAADVREAAEHAVEALALHLEAAEAHAVADPARDVRDGPDGPRRKPESGRTGPLYIVT